MRKSTVCHSRASGNPKRDLALFCLASGICLLFSASAYAGLQVSVTGTPTVNWAIGTIGMGVKSETTGDKWTAAGSSDTDEDVYIKVDGANWSPGEAAGANTFILKHDASGSWSDAITNTDNGIKLTTIFAAGTKSFDLQFTAPTSTTVGGEHTLTVTLTAVAWDGTITDIDGNSYNTVLIGTQRWMKENMRTTKYPDGSAITRGPTGATWDGNDNGYYACPPNTANNAEDCAAVSTLGYVYQWSAAMDGSITAGAQGICPTGWHIPTDAEWYTLENGLATGTCTSTRVGWECDPAGDKLKTAADCFGGVSCGTSGFEALLAGYRYTTGTFSLRGTYTYLWSSLESGTNAWLRNLHSGHATVYRDTNDKAIGFSVRCLQD